MDPRPWHRFYDKGVPVGVDYQQLTIPQVLDKTAAAFPDRSATLFEGHRLTYGQLKDQSDRLATALVRLGLKAGDRVAIQLPNLPQTVVAWLGVLRAGGIAVMTNPMYVQREVEHQFEDANVRIVIALDALWMKTIRPVRGNLHLDHVILTGIKHALPFPKNLLFPIVGKKSGMVVDVPAEPGVIWLNDLLAGTPAAPPPMPADMDAIANLQYTGGTTGLSKGAMLTHRNLSYNAQQALAWFPGAAHGGEVMLSALPFFHSFGLTVCMSFSLLLGAAQVLVPNPRDIKKLVGYIEKYRPTMFPAVPTLYNAVNNYPGIDKVDISSIKGCISGSAPLPMEVLERFEKLTGGRITEGFGLTETSPITHANPLFGLRKPGSIGVPVSDTDARIVDLEEGRKVMGVGEEGELVLAGPQIMKGYWNKPDETADMIRDGWLYTGDIAKMDDEGYFYIVGRKKDMIIAGGYNIYPREIDDLLFEHPKVLEAAAVGIPDPHRGETVKAYIVLKPGEQATIEEFAEYCKSRLAAYKVPKSYEFRAELPKSTVGKVLRRVLRDEEVAKLKAAKGADA
ncbi:MAG: long-chain fatty acid--CoA ligase [Deltaproteobacteria bacterium]|nr:long-chain fatty acid--CoA ligase [Deltaproteobacteria bacterium]